MTRRVLAYEDDPALRNQLEQVFASLRGEYDLLASFPDPTSVIEHLKEYRPDAVLMDLQMLEEDDGLLALFKIKEQSPETKVLVLTMFDADQKVFNAICLGADGYMLKTDFSGQQLPHEALRKSLRMIFDGGAYLTPTVALQIMRLFTDQSFVDKVRNVREHFQSVFKRKDARPVVDGKRLTKMQSVVLQHIIDGKTTAMIARDLSLSEHTINSHIQGIYAVLGVHSRALAIRKAMEYRLIH